MATIHHRSRCPECRAVLLHLEGDPTVPYEDIDPLEGGPSTLVEHTGERCRFQRFLSPPDPALWAPGTRRENRPAKPRYERWLRTDIE